MANTNNCFNKNCGGNDGCRSCDNYRYDSDAKKFCCFANRSEAAKLKSFTVVAPQVKDWLVTVVWKKYDSYDIESEDFRAQATAAEAKKILGKVVNNFVDESSLEVKWISGDPYTFREGEMEKEFYYSEVHLTDSDTEEADEFIQVTCQLLNSLPIKTLRDFEKEGE